MTQVILGVAAVVAVIAFVRRRAARRRAALEAVAQQAGWSFAPDRVSVRALGVSPLPLFTHGRRQRAHGVMRGSDGSSSLAVFDYQYTVGGGKHQSTITQTVVHLRSPRLALPSFVLEPERMHHKIGELFGFHDIDFESSPEFSRRYRLRCADGEERVRELFSPVVCAYFEQHAPLNVEASGGEMVVFRARRVLKPEDVRTFVEDALATARQFERG